MRNWVVVDLDAIRANLDLVRRCAVGRPVLAVVKANAYGHGAGRVARALQAHGCDRLAVGTIEEALELRDSGLRIPIHLLACVPPSDFGRVVGEGFIFTIGSAEEAERLACEARAHNARETVHIEIDTGMGRSGCRVDEFPELLRRVLATEELFLEGMMTHFPSADDPGDPSGAEFAKRQVEILVGLARLAEKLAGRKLILHAANSAGVACIPESLLDLVRPGGALYGLVTGPKTRLTLDTRPALSWYATVVQVRRFDRGQTIGYGRAFVAPRAMVVATLAVGYGDGYARAYGDGGYVLIRGSRAPIVGRISMDSMTVDVSDLEDLRVGEQAVLIGRQGNLEIRAEDLAERAGVSPYEVTCRIAPRVPRIYAPAPKGPRGSRRPAAP